MRLLLTCLSILLASAALAYTPSSNITRGIYLNATPLLSSGYWGKYGAGFEFTNKTAHSGAWSVKCVNQDGAGGAGITQSVRLDQTVAAPLKIAGWSKAEKVGGGQESWQYSLYVDLRYTDGSSWPMQIAAFSPGTHDWEYKETILKPKKPVASASFYAFLRQRTGTVYFDDLFFGPVGGKNLLHDAGFEPADRTDSSARDAIYATLASLHVNAIHTYLSGSPQFWQGENGQGNQQVRDFLKMAAAKRMGVWLTTGAPPLPPFKSADDPNFPQYDCVNGPWGAAWTKTLTMAARYDFAGLSMVPDEYNWTNARLKRTYEKAADPRVAAFYKKLPDMCNCPVCQREYKAEFGEALPPLGLGMTFPAQTAPYLHYLQFRYDSTTAWLTRSVKAVRAVNPHVYTDSLLCVTPICSDFWWGPGVAWDRLGETGLDFPTTDPYIELHNYLGDSTHWYVTETATHLTGSTPRRRCGIVLEASRLRKTFRELDPVEIYGSALSAVAHGARELAWWHYSHITGESHVTNKAAMSRAAVTGVYSLLEQSDPWLDDLHPLHRVAYLHSRASDDFWRFYSQPQPSPILTHPDKDVRYSAVAQQEVLYGLFRTGVPTDLYYLDTVKEQPLLGYPVIVVPFPLAISDGQADLLRRLAEAGKTVLVISEVGTLDENGFPRKQPALLDLIGLRQAPKGETRARLSSKSAAIPQTGAEMFTVYDQVTPRRGVKVLATAGGRPVILEHDLGRGRVIYLAGQFGYDLVANRKNQKRGHDQRIIPDPLAPGHVAVLEALLNLGCGQPASVLAQAPAGKDLEATCLTNGQGDLVVLTTNWESQPVQCELRLPAAGQPAHRRLVGYAIGPDGACRQVSLPLTRQGDSLLGKVSLAGQEARLWRVQG